MSDDNNSGQGRGEDHFNSETRMISQGLECNNKFVGEEKQCWTLSGLA